jgi:hypothetical protein
MLGDALSSEEIVNILNEQHETIQILKVKNNKLKQAYIQLKHRHSLLHDEYVDAECDRYSYRKDIESLEKENEQLKEALKNSYMNEICENCKYGNYCLSDNYYGGFEGDFECLKKNFGNDHWKCDGLTECDEFELEIKGDV